MTKFVHVIYKTGETGGYWDSDAGLERALAQGARRATKKEAKLAEREYALNQIRKITGIAPGSTVYCVLQSRARSGMSRVIQLLVACTDSEKPQPFIFDISGYAATALGYTRAESGGIKVSGCGMDMGFHLVYSLGSALWPNGTPEPHGRRNGEPDSAGGYALKHSWL